jgi:hypothetical protein
MTVNFAGDKAVLVGVRPRGEVERAQAVAQEAGAGERPSGRHFFEGALAVYRWALGRERTAPVTGATTPGRPDLALLTAEADAAIVLLDDFARRTLPVDYTQGVREALAWVCGQADGRP